MRIFTKKPYYPLTITALTLAAGAASANDPVFFSWTRQHDQSANPAQLYPLIGTTNHYTYCPQPGGQHGWRLGVSSNRFVHDVWDDMEDANLPVAILMRDRNSPWGPGPTWSLNDSTYPSFGTTDSQGNAYRLDADQLAFAVVDRDDSTHRPSGQINYILADLEPISPVTNADINTWMNNIKDIATGAFFGGVSGDPFGTGSNSNVSQSTIQNWNTVYFGNYAMHRYPKLTVTHTESDGTQVSTVGPTDVTAAWPHNAQDDTISSRNNTFVSVGPNVLMPVTYAYYAHVRHTVSTGPNAHFSGLYSPTTRSAYMWAGVERQSSAIREENLYGSMIGKKVIPWVSPFIPGNTTDPQGGSYAGGWMPPPEDFLATIKHLRLRGADGFYFWGNRNNHLDPITGTLNANYWSTTDSNDVHLNPWWYPNAAWTVASPVPPAVNGYDWFEANALISWEELDGDYAPDAVVYRLDTDKESGVIVSAVNDQGRLHIMVSYMNTTPGGSPILFDLDTYFLEARDYRGGGVVSTISAAGYSHTYTSNFFTPDIDGDGDADNDDLAVYTTIYNAKDVRADWNQDGFVDIVDFLLFGDAHNAFNN